MLALDCKPARMFTPPLPATLDLQSKVLKACRQSIRLRFGDRKSVRQSDLLGCIRRVSFGNVSVIEAIMPEEEILLTVRHKRGKSHGFILKPRSLTKMEIKK